MVWVRVEEIIENYITGSKMLLKIIAGSISMTDDDLASNLENLREALSIISDPNKKYKVGYTYIKGKFYGRYA